MVRRWVLGMGVAVAVGVTVGAGPARAGGFEFPDNGAAGLAQGGAFAASVDDPSAMYYNPAALAGQKGFGFTLSGNFLLYNASFQRTEADGTRIGDPVKNSTVFQTTDVTPFLPFLAVTYGILDNLTVAAGVWGPSAVPKQSYPDPRLIVPEYFDGDFTNNGSAIDLLINPEPDFVDVVKEAPQRYNLISSSLLIIYPSVAVAFAPTDWLSFGLTGQLVLAETTFDQALYGGLVEGEVAAFDGIASLDVKTTTFTGIIGFLVRPTDSIAVGGSWRPGFKMEQSGTLDLTFNDALSDPDGLTFVEQLENGASFTNTMPHVVRLGVAYSGAGWVAEVDTTWEDWSTVNEFVLKPDIKVEITTGGVTEEIVVVDPDLPKHWKDTMSFRLGGRANLEKVIGLTVPVTVMAGYVFETGAAPTSTLGLDFINGPRHQITAGASYPFGSIDLMLGFSKTFMAARTVTDSIIRQNVSPPPLAPEPYEGTIIGNGVYDADHTILTFGIRGRFGAD